MAYSVSAYGRLLRTVRSDVSNSTVLCSAFIGRVVQYIVEQCSVEQCSVVQCSAVQSSVVQFIAVQCSVVQ